MTINKFTADIVSYQIYAYQEVHNQPPKAELWKKIGDVNALPLPMACSLTQVNIIKKFLRVILSFMFLYFFHSFQEVKNIILQ